MERDFITILDDEESRNFFVNNLTECADNLIGTVGFIGECVSGYTIFEKEKGLNILIAIKNSKFRIKENLIEEVIHKIKDH